MLFSRNQQSLWNCKIFSFTKVFSYIVVVRAFTNFGMWLETLCAKSFLCHFAIHLLSSLSEPFNLNCPCNRYVTIIPCFCHASLYVRFSSTFFHVLSIFLLFLCFIFMQMMSNLRTVKFSEEQRLFLTVMPHCLVAIKWTIPPHPSLHFVRVLLRFSEICKSMSPITRTKDEIQYM